MSDEIKRVVKDIHSGVSLVSDDTYIEEGKQMINFDMLSLDADLYLDGDLWLA